MGLIVGGTETLTRKSGTLTLLVSETDNLVATWESLNGGQMQPMMGYANPPRLTINFDYIP